MDNRQWLGQHTAASRQAEKPAARRGQAGGNKRLRQRGKDREASRAGASRPSDNGGVVQAVKGRLTTACSGGREARFSSFIEVSHAAPLMRVR
jgi:hypothetical protein